MTFPERGCIYWVNLDPTIGTEIKKKRPAVVVSNNAANKRYHQVTMIPLTSKGLDTVEPFQVFIDKNESSLNRDSKALAEQIRTVSKLRLQGKTGQVSERIIKKLEQAIKVHLGMEL